MASQVPDVDLDTDDAFYALHHFVFKHDSMKKDQGSVPWHSFVLFPKNKIPCDGFREEMK
jgi:hypothetical protein